MADQLPLDPHQISSTPLNWRLDERTREAGRRGIASARAALAAHRPQEDGRRAA